MDTWNLVLLFVQAIILIWQLILSCRINQQAAVKEKGYFVLEKTNIPHSKEHIGRFIGRFDLVSSAGVGFDIKKTDLILKGSSYRVDNITYQNEMPIDLYFSEDDNLSKYIFRIDLKPADLKKPYLDMEFFFNLESISGYHYKEKIIVRFERVDHEKIWEIKKYNILFP